MSELSDKVEQALLNTLSDELPGPVTGFVGTVGYLREDGEPGYVMFDLPDQRLNVSLGLVHALSLFYDRLFIDYITTDDDA